MWFSYCLIFLFFPMIPALAIFADLKFELTRQKYFSNREEKEIWR
jgi:hypothetical protein